MTNPLFAQPAPYFHQPDWVEESGKPYPGAEGVAEAIAVNEEQTRLAALAEMEKEKALARRKGLELADEEQGALRKVRARRASEVAVKRTRWLWQDRIPMGELTFIAGKGGVGKSTLLATFCAWITTGDMKGEFQGQERDVLYVANEDSLESTVVPRMMAAGVNLDRVHFLGVDMAGHPDRVIVPSDCDSVSALAKDVGAAAIMLDPFSSNLRGGHNKQDEIRPVMEAVRRMCEESGIAAIGLAHTRKGQSSDLVEAIMGSSEFGNVCRSVMGVMRNEEGNIVLSLDKHNLGPDVPSYEYRMCSYSFEQGGELITTSKIEFIGKTDETVSEMMADQMQPATREAKEFLRDYLTEQGGEASKKDVLAAARGEGISTGTLESAARKLRVVYRRSGFPATSVWSLPQ